MINIKVYGQNGFEVTDPIENYLIESLEEVISPYFEEKDIVDVICRVIPVSRKDTINFYVISVEVTTNSNKMDKHHHFDFNVTDEEIYSVKKKFKNTLARALRKSKQKTVSKHRRNCGQKCRCCEAEEEIA